MTLALLASVPGESLFSPGWGLILGLLLVALNGFFVAAEFALVKVRPTQIDPYVTEGIKRAKVARHMIRHLDAYLSATQLGITLASLALGWIGEPAFAWVIGPVVKPFAGDNPQLLHSLSVTMSFLVITILHIVLGELAPKSLAIRKAEGDHPDGGLSALRLLQAHLSGHLAAQPHRQRAAEAHRHRPGRRGGDRPTTRRSCASCWPPAMLRTCPKQKRELLDNVFELSHRMARQIMLPRQDVVYLYDHPAAGREPADRPPHRPYAVPALRRRPRPRRRPHPHQGPLPP